MAPQLSKSMIEGGASLQSQDHRDLLDIIDKLRSQGLSRFVDIPQIIVCGDQSSGKSSVLEAISGMSFPTKDNLCTRFATELILRRHPTVGVNVHIIPGPDRSGGMKKELEQFEYQSDTLDIGDVVDAAKEAMGLTTADKVFSTDILRVEISGPSQPHLTMVDLPGVFLAGNKDQSEDDSKLVQSLVLSYMKKPRSIILAVVSAKSDFALQQVTRHARVLDPRGMRTLGLITKPDTLDQGSDSERFFVELAQNKDVEFRLGWHVLRNRSYAMRDFSTAQRDAEEAEFFSKGLWTNLDSSQLGVVALRERLSDVLRDQILLQLPSVLEDVESGIKQCEEKLARLGTPRATIIEQRRYLSHAAARFTSLISAAIDGIYADPFFSDAGRDTVSRRLRAVVQNALSEFAESIGKDGHAMIIQDRAVSKEDDPRSVTRDSYCETRGRELPGQTNPLVVSELFSQQCKPWRRLAGRVCERVCAAAFAVVKSTVQHIVDESSAGAIIRDMIDPSVKAMGKDLARKVDELLELHVSGHPITYNHYLTENVQKAQNERHRKQLDEMLKNYARTDDLDQHLEFNAMHLLDKLVSFTEPNMDEYACSMAIDMMEAYYKVALKRFIDDFSVLAVEHILIQQLPSLLSPDGIWELTDGQVHRIAGESTAAMAERQRATEKLKVLENGLAELKRLKPSATGVEFPCPGVPGQENSAATEENEESEDGSESEEGEDSAERDEYEE
ncbi:P-loop containing nucleoside triphosphate hydrolase protein [Xylariomycetidae sp. FL0641]|nr:P-loop containing nucleoside triphosphate hydrolase protein [Xylariomycetidae sp. FL0641]